MVLLGGHSKPPQNRLSMDMMPINTALLNLLSNQAPSYLKSVKMSPATLPMEQAYLFQAKTRDTTSVDVNEKMGTS